MCLRAITRRFLVGLAACALGCAEEAEDAGPEAGPAAAVDTSVTQPDAERGQADTADPDTVPAAAAAAWTAGDTSQPASDGMAVMRAVRTARHNEFDRMVFEFEEVLPGYRISYIDRPVRQCGSGDVVPFEGDAWLSLVFEPANAHTEEGRATIAERSRRLDLPNIIEFKLICDFEGQVEWVAGVHSPMAYRVLTLTEPARIVVDVRHADRGR